MEEEVPNSLTLKLIDLLHRVWIPLLLEVLPGEMRLLQLLEEQRTAEGVRQGASMQSNTLEVPKQAGHFSKSKLCTEECPLRAQA